MSGLPSRRQLPTTSQGGDLTGDRREDRRGAAVPVRVSSPTPDPSPEEEAGRRSDLTAALVAELAGQVAVEAAREDLLRAQGAVRVAQARLRESLDATPGVDPRVVAAEAALSTARARAQGAAELMADRDRELADAEGELRVARAVLAELEPQSLVDVDEVERRKVDPAAGGRGEPSRVAAARVAVERRRRAVEAAEARLLHSQEERATAEGWLGQAEEELSVVLEVSAAAPPVESADVTEARVRLDDETRAAEAAAARLARLEADPSVATVMRAVAGPAEAGQFQPLATADTRSGRDPASPAGSAAGAEAGGEKVPVYASLDAFVEGYVLPQWRHKLGVSVHWCAYWFRHAEAVSRLEAVWEAWEVMRRDTAPAMSTWWRDHLDPHMRMLTDADGVFYRCSAEVHEPAHEQAAVWSAHTAPDGLFATDPDAPEQPIRVTRAAHVTTAAGAGEAAARGPRLATTFPPGETTRGSASPEEPADTSWDTSWGTR